jgi:hypothetical protein
MEKVDTLTGFDGKKRTCFYYTEGVDRKYISTFGMQVVSKNIVVSPARMVSRGYGETQPVASNATPEGRAENRRVELRELR